jgi:hypothetical protein
MNDDEIKQLLGLTDGDTDQQERIIDQFNVLLERQFGEMIAEMLTDDEAHEFEATEFANIDEMNAWVSARIPEAEAAKKALAEDLAEDFKQRLSTILEG